MCGLTSIPAIQKGHWFPQVTSGTREIMEWEVRNIHYSCQRLGILCTMFELNYGYNSETLTTPSIEEEKWSRKTVSEYCLCRAGNHGE